MRKKDYQVIMWSITTLGYVVIFYLYREGIIDGFMLLSILLYLIILKLTHIEVEAMEEEEV